MIHRFAVLSLSALALAVMAAPAGAAAPELRGVVSGSPYGASGGYIAVPVLYSKMTARRVGLKSPVGLMVVKRNARVKVNGGPSSLPINLRVGDRFKGGAPVSSLNKRIFYPRITFDRSPQVYFRSKELSLSELTRMIQAVEKNLGILTGQFGGLAQFTVKTFQDHAVAIAGLQRQIDELRGLLGGLSGVDLSNLQSQIDGLKKQVDDLLANLANYALKSDLPDVSGFVNAAQVQAMIDAAIGALDLLTEADVNALITSAITALNLDQYATDLDLTAATDRITQLETDLQTVCTAVDGASVTIDPDGPGALPAVTAPLDLGNSVASVCGV